MRLLLALLALLLGALDASAQQYGPWSGVTPPVFVLRPSAVDGGGAFSGQLLAPTTPTNCSAPQYSFNGDANTGIGYVSADIFSGCSGGFHRFTLNGRNFAISANGLIGFTDTNDNSAQSIDTLVAREAAGHSFWKNSTNAQRASWANTYTSATNYEAFSVDWQTVANEAVVGMRTAATGTGRALRLVAQGDNAADGYAIARVLRSGPFLRADVATSALAAVSTAVTGNWFQFGGAVTSTATSGSINALAVLPVYNQTSGTAANTDILINRTETAVGSGTQRLLEGRVGGTTRFAFRNDGLLSIQVPSTGTTVTQLSSTATNDDPTENTTQYRVATTDATPTAIATFTIPTSTSTLIKCSIVARRTGGTAGAAEDSAMYDVAVGVKNTAGTVAEIAGETLTVYGESQAAWTITAAAAGATEVVSVTGAANNNVTWHATCRTYGVNQ